MSTQTPSQKSSLRLVPIALAGAALAAALVTSLLVQLQPEASGTAAEQPSTSAPVAPAAPRAYASAESDATAARLLALEHRLARLAATPAPALEAAAAAQEVPEQAAPPAPVDLKEQQRQVHEAFEQQVAAALREPSDVIWSSRISHTLQGELHSLRGEDTYQVSKIDCRSRSCVAELSFPSQADARTSIARLVINTNLEGCASTGHIDPTEDPASPSRMRLLFNCERSAEAR